MAKKAVVKNKVVKKTVSKMDIARKAIQKKYGDVVKPMSEKPLIIDTISTGSIGLDAAIGLGGPAISRIYEVFGPNSAGKTTLAMSLIASAQSRGMKAAFVDAEHSACPNLFKSMGVDIDKLDVIDLYVGEDNLDAAEILMRSGDLDLLVVDSITSLIPRAQSEKEIGDVHVATLARLMSSVLLRYTPIAAEMGVCVVFINQIRNKVGGYGNPETTPSGEAIKFYSTGRIRVSTAGKSGRIVNDDGVVIGDTIKFEVVKNKLAAPYTKSEAPLYFGKGYCQLSEVISIATDLGILVKKGSWYSYEGGVIGQGLEGAKKFFLDDHGVYLIVKKEVTDMLGITKYYDAQKERDLRVASEK